MCKVHFFVGLPTTFCSLHTGNNMRNFHVWAKKTMESLAVSQLFTYFAVCSILMLNV